MTLQTKYKPAKVAKILIEQYGHKVTPSVIRKWDNYFGFSTESSRPKGNNRRFTEDDLDRFNLVAVLRNTGYSLEEIAELLITDSKHTIMSRLEKQYEALISAEAWVMSEGHTLELEVKEGKLVVKQWKIVVAFPVILYYNNGVVKERTKLTEDEI